MPLKTKTDSPDVADHLISYPHSFVTATGNVSSAIFLSQLLSLSKSASETEGWISKSMKEWEDLTGLKRHEQETARKNLRAIKFLEEETRGMPATVCFRLKHDEIARLLPEANPYAENGILVNKLVCSLNGADRNPAESLANQFAENSDSLVGKPANAVMYPQTEQKISNERIFEERVRVAFNWLGKKIDVVKEQTELLNKQTTQAELLNKQSTEKSKPLEQIKFMLIGLLVMAFLILMLCISIWRSQPDYATPSKPAASNTALQNRK